MSNISVLIIGNKKDMEGDRKATYVEGKSKADYYNVQYLETSAIDNDNIEDAFV